MKLKLKVLDSGMKKLTIKDYIEQKIPIKLRDDRWNIEYEFEIPERMILKLVEEVIDQLEDQQFYILDGMNRLRKKELTYNEMDKLIKSTRSWKKIHILISDSDFETSRFTRISLFENLLDNKKMDMEIQEKLMKLEQEAATPKIPEEKSAPKKLSPIEIPKQNFYEIMGDEIIG